MVPQRQVLARPRAAAAMGVQEPAMALAAAGRLLAPLAMVKPGLRPPAAAEAATPREEEVEEPEEGVALPAAPVRAS